MNVFIKGKRENERLLWIYRDCIKEIIWYWLLCKSVKTLDWELLYIRAK